MRLLIQRAARAVATIGVALLALIGLTAGPVSATVTHVVVSGAAVNGAFSASTSNAALTDSVTGFTMPCYFSASPEYAGQTLTNGTYTSSPPLPRAATVTSASLMCALSYTFYGTPQALPWSLNLTGPTAAGGRTPATVSGLRVSLSGLPAPCSLTLAGTSATTGATVGGYFTNPGGLKLDGSGDLHIWNAGNCGSWFSSGDAAALTGDFSVNPTSLAFTAS
ncbi:hypothetical protein [Streptomyces sp. NPDC020983]|uniref:hypothetical protein n=1 Tax=Streptomyces sp. NPDC020983 TaxID=3365106 RepID=UPI0037A356C2